ncbi:hypothetical protein BS78_07G038800 [Paspalum vaginatum]|nr:hypothetical protein BS78_07G038800 [Paspalum vaginatum]
MLLASLATLFIAGDACDNIPSLTWNDTCTMACSDEKTPPELYNVCKEILTTEALYISPMTVYASVAAKHATKCYDDTVSKIDEIIARGLPGADVREAYRSCINMYATARMQMAGVVSDMDTCRFAGTKQEYVTAVAGVQSCREKLRSPEWPLVDDIAADLDVTTVAYKLGGLVLAQSGS